MSTVLISAFSDDREVAPRVVAALRARGARCVLFPADLYPSPGLQLSLRFPRGGSLKVEGEALDLAEVDAIWLRRAGVGQRAVLALDPEHRAATREEATRTFSGMLDVFQGFLLDPPERWRGASKVRQLALAPQVGLVVVPTLITSDPEEARSFIEENPGGVVAKMLHDVRVQQGEAEATVYTNRIRAEDVEALDGLVWCPMQLQALVERVVELRVIAVGRRVWAGALKVEEGQVDWRRTGARDLRRWQPWTLPAEVEAAVLAMQARLGLNYGAYDFIVRPSGEHVFLEVTPTGEWFWLQDVLGFAIAEELAELLMGRRERIV